MTSEIIGEQIENIQEQGFLRLKELSILVLSLQLVFFIDYWFGDWWDTRPFVLELPNANSIGMGYDTTMLILSFVFLIGIVSYFWRLQNAAQLRVLFIQGKKERKQIDTKRFFRLILLPAAVSIGLSVSPLYYGLGLEGSLAAHASNGFGVVGENYWWSPANTDKFFVFYPLIIVICSCVLLYFIYRITPVRLQRGVPWLFFIPIGLSSVTLLSQIGYNLLDWYSSASTAAAPRFGSPEFVANVVLFSYYTLFLASFSVLLYLTYHIYVRYRTPFTVVEEKHLHGIVEEGIVILPKKVREGESHHIFLNLTLSKDFIKRASHIDDRYRSNEYLEAELQAPGLIVDGEKRIRIFEDAPLPIISWTCHFPTIGIQKIAIMINLVKSDHSRRLIFMQRRDIKVDSLMNIAWMPALAVVTPVLIAIAQIVFKMR
ncbi:MAG TPA: hypothetical protein VEG44_09080 [Candidatus Acidoferrales bacterium]|nr:hypothetical protein [Candidatus Acidoferrales bacterium]